MPNQSGDLVFCASKGAVSRGIRIAEWFRRDWEGATERPGSKYNHVAILDQQLMGDWTIIQAEGRGVTDVGRLSTVAVGGSYTIVSPPAGVDHTQLLAFARSQVGRSYGFATIVSILVTLLSPRFFNVMLPGTWICSALAGESLRFGGWFCNWSDIYEVSPAQLWVALEN